MHTGRERELEKKRERERGARGEREASGREGKKQRNETRK